MTTKVYNSFACDFSPYIISDALQIGIGIVESRINTHALGESARLYTHSVNIAGQPCTVINKNGLHYDGIVQLNNDL